MSDACYLNQELTKNLAKRPLKLGVVYDNVANPFMRLICPLVIIADFVIFLPEQADELWMDE